MVACTHTGFFVTVQIMATKNPQGGLPFGRLSSSVAGRPSTVFGTDIGKSLNQGDTTKYPPGVRITSDDAVRQRKLREGTRRPLGRR
jgi:hypothetical protein